MVPESAGDAGPGSLAASETRPIAAIVATRPAVAPACASTQGLARVVCLTEAFKATLSPSQLAEVQRPYSEAEAARWPNLPQ